MKHNLYGVLIISAILFACASVSELKKEHLFDETMRVYSKVIRWSDFETVYAFRKNTEKGVDPGEMDRFKDIRVTRYDVQQIMREDKFHVKQVVEIQYYLTGEMKERRFIGQELWEFDETSNKWYLIEGFPFDF